MHYLRGFSALRADPEWMGKIGVGTLLYLSVMCVPIVGQVALIGWSAAIVRGAREHKGTGPMPRLDLDFGWIGKLVGVGFKPFLINFLWRLPAGFLAAALFMCIYFGGIMAAVGTSQASGSEAAGGIMSLIVLAMMLLMFPIMILVQLPAQMAVLRVELTDDMNQGFKVREIFAMTRSVLKELVLGSLLLGIVSAGLMILGMLACYVGMFPAYVVITVLHAHFSVQLYELYLERGGEPLPEAPHDVAVETRPLAPAPPAAPSAPSGW